MCNGTKPSMKHLADVQDVAAPVHGVVGQPLLRRHVGAVLGKHLAGPGHLEAGVARPALDRDYRQNSGLLRCLVTCHLN